MLKDAYNSQSYHQNTYLEMYESNKNLGMTD